MKLQAGQRIEVFEVLNHGAYDETTFDIGTFRGSEPFSDKSALLLSNGNGYLYMGIKENSSSGISCRPVGAMIIKEVKE